MKAQNPQSVRQLVITISLILLTLGTTMLQA